ncbi:MAG: protein phosphatase 2C domain-containing protein [Pseudomonadota bacterium]
MTAKQPNFAADTHSGLKRKHNEDCFAAKPDLGLWLVADGIGGHASGEVASHLVCCSIAADIERGISLREAVINAHGTVLAAMQDQADRQGMGSTIVALRLTNNEYELCWVGDSRAYLLNGGLQQLTQDHNRVGYLLSSGEISPVEAKNHPERHILTQSLGVTDEMLLQPGYASGSLSGQQKMLLCSDGLTEELSDSLIEQLISEHDTPRAQVDALISAALDAGGSDNITAVIVCPQNGATGLTERRSASGGKPNDGKLPMKTLLALSAILLGSLLFLD